MFLNTASDEGEHAVPLAKISDENEADEKRRERRGDAEGIQEKAKPQAVTQGSALNATNGDSAG